MATTPFSIIAGPANIWVAATGTAFPATNAAPSGSWTTLGRTDGGVTVDHQQTVNFVTYDQGTGKVKAYRADEGLEISFNMLDVTLENFAVVMNNIAVTTQVGPPATKTLSLYQNLDVAQFAFLVRGPSPYFNGIAQYQVPVVVQTDAPNVVYKRDDKVMLQVKFTALEDPAAGSVAVRFGSLVAQTS